MRTYQGKKTTSLADALEAIVAVLISPPCTNKIPKVTLRRHVYDKKPLLQYTVYLTTDKDVDGYGIAQVWVLTYPDTNEFEITPIARRDIEEFFELHPELEGKLSTVFTMLKTNQRSSRHRFNDIVLVGELVASAMQGWDVPHNPGTPEPDVEGGLTGPDEETDQPLEE